MLILRSKSPGLFLKPPHLRSDHRDPGRDPGRELGRELSWMTMLGTLRNEVTPDWTSSDLRIRVSSPAGAGGINPPFCPVLRTERAVAGRSSNSGEAALVLKERPLGSGGVSDGVGNETERMATGR